MIKQELIYFSFIVLKEWLNRNRKFQTHNLKYGDKRSAPRFGRKKGLATFSCRLLGVLMSATFVIKRKEWSILPVYKMVDTCAAQFEANSNYFYSSYFGENEHTPSAKRKVAIIGSGPIRIGQGIEFDYCSVHGVLALKKENVETILINNNPETVSTDFVIADRLYFEPLILETVLNVIETEGISEVIVQLGWANSS